MGKSQKGASQWVVYFEIEVEMFFNRDLKVCNWKINNI